jgi:hypothetical protein
MPKRKADEGLDFEALRRGIERCDPDLVLGFYAEDARISIVDARAPQSSHPFELRGKAEIAKHLRAVYGQKASHRVGRGATVGEDRVTFRETCGYPDGSRVLVETTLEVRDGKIARQVDVVAKDARAGASLLGRLPSSEQAAKEEDSW